MILQPLQSQKCIDLIKQYLNDDIILLEVGSGYSTIDFCSKVKKVYSIEHDYKWYKKINEIIEDNGIKNIEYKLQIPDTDYISSKYNISGIGGGGGKYWEYNMYPNYIEQIGQFNTKFDVCFIDGQARMHCYLYVFNYLNDDGIVMIHDFYNCKNLDKQWNLKILYKYYDKIDSIEQICKQNRGNDVIILRKKNNVIYDHNDMKELDSRIPRYN